jgi:Xaa-Pro aminopeptidase
VNTQPRLASLRQRLADEEAGAALITQRVNMLYLTGFEGVIDSGVNAACVVTAEGARFYTDARYSEAAVGAAEGTPWEVRLQKESLYIELCCELRREGVETVVMEASAPYGRFKFISEQFAGNVQVVEQWVEEIREVKERAEIERIERAAALTDRAFDHVLGMLAPGLSEIEVALEIEFFMRRNGSEGVAFEPIVASGPNSARPHAMPSDRRLQAGDLVVMDFGSKVGGYCSDMTRTVVIGKANDRQRELYEAVLAANLAAIAGLRAGMSGSEVDLIARDVLTQRGLGEHLAHGVGHGVGLAVHELPSLGARSREAVRGGSVVTIEPGVYIPGFGGARIEDLVHVDEAGARLLSHAAKEMIEI